MQSYTPSFAFTAVAGLKHYTMHHTVHTTHENTTHGKITHGNITHGNITHGVIRRRRLVGRLDRSKATTGRNVMLIGAIMEHSHLRNTHSKLQIQMQIQAQMKIQIQIQRVKGNVDHRRRGALVPYLLPPSTSKLLVEELH